MQRSARVRARSSVDTEALARFFHGLADPDRVRILTFLLDGPRTAGQIVRHLGRAQSSTAAHVTCLRFCGYVEARRQGRNVVYEIIDPDVRRLLQMGERYLQANAERIRACRVISSETEGRTSGSDRLHDRLRRNRRSGNAIARTTSASTRTSHVAAPRASSSSMPFEVSVRPRSA